MGQIINLILFDDLSRVDKRKTQRDASSQILSAETSASD